MATSSGASNASNVLLDGYEEEEEEEEVEDDEDDDEEEDDEINKASAQAPAAAARLAAFSSQDYQDALEEVHTRFILNLPPSELETADRIFFQLEQAWWFYEDWICDKQVPANQNLPRFATLRPFALKLFEYSPLLPSPDRFGSMWSEFTKYKRKISNYGCILLNANCDKVVLCQVWNSKTFTFPAGKINQGETGITAAARETYEETGFDPHCEFGRTSEMKEQQQAQQNTKKLSWNFPLREKDALVYQENDGKRRTCYVCRGVPEDFPFAPVVRKEVAKIDWYPLNDLPRSTYAVSPFLAQLRRWIKKRKTTTAAAASGSKSRQRSSQKSRERVGAQSQQQQNKTSDASAHKSRERGNKSRERGTPSKNRSSNNNKKSTNTPNRSRQNSRQRLREDDQLVQAGLAEEGDLSGWSEEDMFLANEKILGRKIEYDGNPHHFVEQGFGVQDPHAFHVVGGGFLNSTVGSLAPPPETSKLQPLFRKEDAGHGYGNGDDDDDGLQPFFSESGATPWGEVVSEATTDDEDRGQMHPTPSVSPIRKGGKNARSNKKKKAIANIPAVSTTAVDEDEGTSLLAMLQQGGGDSCFLTDREITAQSQARNRRLLLEKSNMDHNDPSSISTSIANTMTMSYKPKASSWAERREQLRQQYQRDWEYIQQWVANLPPSPPTKEFGTFRLDANAIMETAALHVQQQMQY